MPEGSVWGTGQTWILIITLGTKSDELENTVARSYERARDREGRRDLVRTYNVVNDMQMKDQTENSRGWRKVCWREVVSEPEEHHVILVLRHLEAVCVLIRCSSLHDITCMFLAFQYKMCLLEEMWRIVCFLKVFNSEVIIYRKQIYQEICLSFYLSVGLSVCVCVCVCVCVSVCLSIFLSIHPTNFIKVPKKKKIFLTSLSWNKKRFSTLK